MLKFNTDKDRARFLAKIDASDISGCWRWTGVKNSDGYGHFMFNGSMRSAHRVSWVNWIGDPGDKHVLHRCDVRDCVRPDHLFLGSHKDNMADRSSKRRYANQLKTKCSRGHELSAGNLTAWGLRINKRICRICHRAKVKRARLKACQKLGVGTSHNKA